jgi:site-specific recombinase XerD
MDFPTLPPDAQQFLQTPQGTGAETTLCRFHRFMKAKHLTPTELSLEDVESFLLNPFPGKAVPRTAYPDKRKLIRYLNKLNDEGQLGFDPRQLSVQYQRPLPELARLYVKSFKPTHKRKTWQGYQNILSQFHQRLDDNRISVKQLDRAFMEQWMVALFDHGYVPITRAHMLTVTRAYLRWLFERGELRGHPDDLIRSSDMPKLPKYLPRPLPPPQDAALQQRLESSSNRLHQALLLMRLTGLRLGELARLPCDCIRLDLHGQAFLKVPLGKLNNERLVPIDDRVVAIVESLLQKMEDPNGHQYLVENTYGEPISGHLYGQALAEACEDIESTEPITSHRLRHSYATSMLAAGVSLPSLMRLLGHRDIRMTLRYAAVTQELITREYFQALPKLESRYRDALRAIPSSPDFDPIKSLVDTSQWIRKHIATEATNQRIPRSLLKRLARIQADLDRQIASLSASRPR